MTDPFFPPDMSLCLMTKLKKCEGCERYPTYRLGYKNKDFSEPLTSVNSLLVLFQKHGTGVDGETLGCANCDVGVSYFHTHYDSHEQMARRLGYLWNQRQSK